MTPSRPSGPAPPRRKWVSIWPYASERQPWRYTRCRLGGVHITMLERAQYFFEYQSETEGRGAYILSTRPTDPRGRTRETYDHTTYERENTRALTHERRSHDTRAPRAQHAGRRTRPWTWLGRVVGAPPARARAHAVAETRLETARERGLRGGDTPQRERECTQKFKIIGTHQIGLYIGPCSSISAYTVLRLRFDYRFGAAYTRRPAPRQRASAPASTATHGSRRACWLCTPGPAA